MEDMEEIEERGKDNKEKLKIKAYPLFFF